ncbi:transporter substrate-binding domain-containing protein [Salinicola avicenniae]|uniref:transporter substrate-binding domain-containing protein n=1 Tax=Salinicola avicenniae TaxID=2916836 RepID=UPI002073FD50|nr:MULTISPECIES: transporter substrate-binding domain-containing protein [unclassified Salinicola]
MKANGLNSRALKPLAFALSALGLAALSGPPVQAADDISPTAEAFSDMPACQSLREQYPDLGDTLKVGLGGYTKGWEAPTADDPSQLEGLDPSLFDRIGSCLGMTPSYQNGSFNVLLTSIASGRVDIGPMLYVTDERKEQVSFVASIQVRDSSIVKQGNPEALTSMDDLCGKTVASAAGTYEAATLIPQQSQACTAAGKPAVSLLLVQNTDNSIQAVRSGRADIYLTEAGSARQISAQDPTLDTAFSIDLPIMVGYPLAKDNTTLINAVHDALAVIQSTGAEKRLLERWGQGADGERPVAIFD